MSGREGLLHEIRKGPLLSPALILAAGADTSTSSASPPKLPSSTVQMSDSDGEYVADGVSDEESAHQVSKHGTRSAGPIRGVAVTKGGDIITGPKRKKATWEDVSRSWDSLKESADGSINSAVAGLREAGKRKR